MKKPLCYILSFLMVLTLEAQKSYERVQVLPDPQTGTRIVLSGDMLEKELIQERKSNFADRVLFELLPGVNEQPARDSTASANVHIVDTAFYIPQLNRYRRVWIYLPPSYKKTRKKYPVLYMQDGQNVFDNATSFSGEWGVDEAIDSLAAGSGEMIVVAVDNGGGHRMGEYSPSDNQYGKAEGDAYVDFLVQTLMPYIQKNYRSRKCGRHNFIAGSSMGALISFYAMVKYPKKFGGAGIFSPSFWLAPELKTLPQAKARKLKGKIYFFAGMMESEKMVPDMLQVFENLKKYSKAEIKTVIRAEGKHNEATWRDEFPAFYQFINSK